MTDTTETVWYVDGVSLQTYAFNITSLGGDRKSPPPLRGENIQVPYKPGSVWMPRVVDSKIITLGMWVQGSDEAGAMTSEGPRFAFERNWQKLRDLFWVYERELILTKRFWVLTTKLAGHSELALKTQGAWSLVEASTPVSFRSGLEPSMTGPAHGAFTVDLLLSDPFFYSTKTVQVDFSMSSVAPAPGPKRTFNVAGESLTTDIGIEMEGPLITPTFTISSYERKPWLKYATEIKDGDSASISVKDWSATHDESGDPYASSGYVSHYGGAPWLWLRPGSTTVVLSAQSGTGVASLTYRPAWL